MVEKTKRTIQKKATKENKTENLPVKVHKPENKPQIQAMQTQKVFAKKNKSPRQNSSIAEVLVDICQKLIKKSFILLIFWLLLSLGVLLTGSYIIFKEFFIGMAYPWWYLLIVIMLLFGIYGFVGFFYGLTMAFLHSILSISTSLGENIKKIVLRIKNSIESRVDKFADNLEQNSLTDTIKRTFDDISKNIRKYAAKTVAGVFIIALLGGVLFVIKNIMVKSFKKVQNKAEFFTKLSIRFSLLIAIILNLKLFVKIALFIGYLIGVFLVLSQFIIWQIMQ